MKNFRAPAYPLLTVDPYLNVWSFTDRLTDDVPRHWTGQRQFMTGVLTVDGIHYRFMGKVMPDSSRTCTEPDALEQVEVEVLPLTTRYVFENDAVTLTVEFMTPLLMDDLMLLSRPISYVTYTAAAKDGREHDFTVYMDVSFEMCVDNPEQECQYGRTPYSITASSGKEKMLSRSGDDHRIEWGTLHLIAPEHETYAITALNKATKFRYNTTYPLFNNKSVLAEDKRLRPMDGWPALACEKKASGTSVSGFLCIGYDDIKSIQYFGVNIEAYWRKDGASFDEIAKLAVEEYESVKARADRFDAEFTAKASAISEKYAQIVSLAYRQAIAGHKLTWYDGELQFFSKDNFSNGCIATVDVTYPSIPLFLIFNPDLVEGMLHPIFRMCDYGLWHYEFAPHDVGQYPLANMQVYGLSERYIKRYFDGKLYLKGITLEEHKFMKQMPIEECGNMLLCVAAVCAAKKDTAYAEKHRAILTQWADYLVKMGYNPENQLCTDDFAGHLAHNCNLSVKAIEALAAWAQLLDKMGSPEEAKRYRDAAEGFAKQWQENAFDGDHYRLAFDREDSWSLKYNMVWDKLLGLNIFDPAIAEMEVKYYLTKVNPYGVPLDVRSDYTKSDWQMWTTILTDNREYLDAVVDGMCAMLENTRDRVPFSDYYYTSTPYMRGFQNRTVQGGLFINLLKF
ncbi:MAG: DUF4965 domain-containing protein [Clostridia bacterium]|nr:DUF4965 domain-containing protein [Clostridia bacterium]